LSQLEAAATTQITITDKEAAHCIEHLWRDAFAKEPFDTLCTLLEVSSGIQGAGGDPLEESDLMVHSGLALVALPSSPGNGRSNRSICAELVSP